MKLWMIYLIIVNLAALVLMYSDKQRAPTSLAYSGTHTLSLCHNRRQYRRHCRNVSVPSQDPTLVLRHRYARDSRGADRGMGAAVPLDRTVWRNSKAIIDNNPR